MEGEYETCYMHLDSIFPESTRNFLAGLDSNLSEEAKLRLRWFDYYQKTGNISLTCRYFGISRKTFHKWKKRYNPWDLNTLNSHSKRPKKVRSPEIPLEIQDLIVKLRRTYPAWSKYKLEVILKRDHGVEISSSSIGRIIKRKGLILPKETRRRQRAIKHKRLRATKELKVETFGDLVQLDTKHFWLPWGEKRYHYAAIDCLGKMKHSRVYKSLSSRKAKMFFLEVKNKFPFPIRRVQTDNGSEFALEFDKLLKKEEIPHYFTYPSTPKQNSIVERVIQTDIKEFYEQGNLSPDLNEQNRLLEKWDETYNTYRPHQSLDFLTPFEYNEKHRLRHRILKPITVTYVLNQNRNLTKWKICDIIPMIIL